MSAMRPVFALVVLVVVIGAAPAQPRAGGARGECFILAREGRPPLVSDVAECGRATAPASTFKIPHAVIALDAGVVTPTSVFRWDGTNYPNESWRRDHTLATAIQWSVFPFFQDTARRLGAERMKQGLARLKYSADSFDREIDAFWVNGDLVVSPLEQFRFLERLAAGDLPMPREHLTTVIEAMRMPPGQVLMAAGAHPFALTWPADTVVRAKTGNTTVAGERVSWLVGMLETRGTRRVFVARVRDAAALPGSAGADLALRQLNANAPQAAASRR